MPTQIKPKSISLKILFLNPAHTSLGPPLDTFLIKPIQFESNIKILPIPP